MSNSSSSRNPPPPPPVRQPSEADDVTWLDFLRTAGNTVPAERNPPSSSSSIDRKRRHAGSSPERRGYPFTPYDPSTTLTGRRPSGMNIAGVPGSSRDNATDLSTPPRQERQQRPQIPLPMRGSGSNELRSTDLNNSAWPGGLIRDATPRRRDPDDDLIPNKDWLGGLNPDACPQSGDPINRGNAGFIPVGAIRSRDPSHDLTPNMDWLGGIDPNAAPRSQDPNQRHNAGLGTDGPDMRHGGPRGVVRTYSMLPTRELQTRGSDVDVVLPPWQPDADVSKCPVCQKDFHFFNRRHHCRKCGRVVCAACSPHRITIPRQYIVQPPASSDGEQVPPSPNSGANPGRNLGGGEEVRVCNPCVPDPWTPETAPAAATRPQQTERGQRRDSYGQGTTLDRYRHPAEAAGRTRAYSHQPTQLQHHQRPGYVIPNLFVPSIAPRGAYGRPPPVPPQGTRPISHRHTQSSSNAPGLLPHFPQMPPGQMPQPVPPPPTQHRRPRREIREEDECPVCGAEMPPGANIREAHIQECISLRFSSTPSSSSLPTHPPSAPPPRTSSMPSVAGPNPSTTPSIPGIPPSNTSTPPNSRPQDARPRATSFVPRGMVRYRATEKDCLTEDGEPQECVICFEEFQPGDEMGRMECLCKFHRLCIRQWWDTKGSGSCPTHQLHD